MAAAAQAGVDSLRRAVAKASRCTDDARNGRALAALGSALVHAVRGHDSEGAVILHEAMQRQRAGNLVQWSANMSNFGALIYPFMLMYLNSKLPRPARPGPASYVLLVANFLFFGFFFVNFVADFIGDPLVTF